MSPCVTLRFLFPLTAAGAGTAGAGTAGAGTAGAGTAGQTLVAPQRHFAAASPPAQPFLSPVETRL